MRARVQGFDPATGVIRVWHSSPYEFDQFTMDRLGLGESNSTHARGQYFAEHPSIGGHAGKYWRQFHQRFSDTEMVLKHVDGREKAIEQIQRYLGHKQPDNYELMKFLHQVLTRRLRLVLQILQDGRNLNGPFVYDVALRASPSKFLTFEKPILHKGKSYLGRDLYRSLVHELGEAEATVYLQDVLGIPGARYLDALSRAPGTSSPSYNYVVWDLSIIEIVGKMRSNQAERTIGEANALV